MGHWPDNLSVHTKAGANLDAVLPEAGMLNVTKAVLGSGRVEAQREVLASQTGISEPFMECPVKAVYLGDGKAEVTVLIDNEALDVGTDCWQIGIYALDVEDNDVLFFIQQATECDHIPTAAQTPLVLRHIVTIEHSNMLDINVTPPEYMSVPYEEFIPVRDKLANIEDNANKYIHPDTHPASMITDLNQFKPQLIVRAPEGSGVTAVCENDTVSGTINESPVTFDIPSYGDWTVTATLEGSAGIPKIVTVDTVKQYHVAVIPCEYYYGYDLDLDDPNPATRVSYPSDVLNDSFSGAFMNYDTGIFDYGDWNFAPGEKFMPKPCMLTYEGTVDHHLNPNDYTKKTDGSASRVADTSFSGNAMMEWPKIYTKRWEEDGVYKFRCCDVPLDNDYECWCNYDRNNNQIDHFYTPVYFGSNVSGKMRSISGQANLVFQNADTEITYAKANGNDWYTEVLADRLLIQDLLVMMSKTTEGQTAFGQGHSASGNSSTIGQGTMNTKGLFWGSTNGTDGVKVFGMENWWGNLWRRIAGWINDNGTQKVKITRGTKDGSTVSDYNTTGSGYKNLSGATPPGTSGGYISVMKTEAFGRIPVTASGSSSTYEADGLGSANGYVSYAFVGGPWSYALLGGPFCAGLGNEASHSGASVGTALSCKPAKT